MLNDDDLRRLLAQGRYVLSRHALRRMVERNISDEMIREAAVAAEVIEDYPNDKYSPSCLLLGFTAAGVPLHVQVSRTANPDAKIITLYVPDPLEWDGFRNRKANP